jgi:hypothetical protein
MMLREKVASDGAARRAKVMDHQRAWQEAAPAVDPSQWPQCRLLLDCMSPEVLERSASMTHFGVDAEAHEHPPWTHAGAHRLALRYARRS